MCAYELLGLLLFIAMLIIVYLPALAILGRRVVMHILRKGLTEEVPARLSKWRVVENAMLFVAAIGLLLMAYGYFVEPYWLEVTRTRIESAKLSNYDRPIRIVHISDLHCDPVDRVETRVARLVAEQKPDLIVFTGDAINSRAATAVFRQCLRSLSAVAPTFAVLGNHDSRCWWNLDLFKNTNVTVLNGDARKVNIAGQDLYIAGVSVDSESLMPKALSAVPAGAFTLFLYHSPDMVLDLAKRRIDLICAGHTHGGQVCLPFYGAVVTQSKFGKRFESGLHKISDTWMYVNRGIGMEGGIDPRVRFLSRPEITVIDLEPTASRISLSSKQKLKG